MVLKNQCGDRCVNKSWRVKKVFFFGGAGIEPRGPWVYCASTTLLLLLVAFLLRYLVARANLELTLYPRQEFVVLLPQLPK